MTEDEMIKRAIEKDEEAFIHLMQLYQEVLYRTALAYLKNEDAAIEAVQEVTFRAFHRIHTVRQPQYIKTSITRIMINYCHDERKKKERTVPTEQIELSVYDRTDEQLYLKEALNRLSIENKRIIYLKYFQNATNKEIAAFERIPEGTVKSRLHYALKAMRRFFSEKGEHDDV